MDRVTLELQPGKITCLIGGNGSGKTTLLNLISGFLRPEAGSIRLGEIELTKLSPYQISRSGIARTFQDLRVIGKLSVRENVLLALPGKSGERLQCALLPSGFHRGADRSDHQKIETLLADFFLMDVADHPASEISFGQQKLLTLACCSAMEARVLLLDEPVAGISPEYRERIAERLANLRTKGETILLIEHQPDFLESVGDDFLFLQTGQLHHFNALANLRAAHVAHDALT